MIVAVTGATGFIGKRLVERHLSLNHQVRFLTRNTQSFNYFVGAKGYIADLSQPDQVLEDFVDGADVVYHLAAELQDEARMWTVNVEGTRNLLDVAYRKVGRWVQLSSTGVYGARSEALITEKSLLKPNNLYEKSKAEADRLVQEYSENTRLPAIILRPSNVYGSEMPNQSLFQLISIINRGFFFFVGKRGAFVNYVHVDNVVDALILCADSSLPAQLSTYIVSDYCSLEALVEIIALKSGKPIPKLRVPEPLVRFFAAVGEKVPGVPLKQSRIDAITSRVLYSSQLISKELGHRNRVSIEEGFSELVAAWKKSHV